jgi:hypothetical protein
MTMRLHTCLFLVTLLPACTIDSGDGQPFSADDKSDQDRCNPGDCLFETLNESQGGSGYLSTKCYSHGDWLSSTGVCNDGTWEKTSWCREEGSTSTIPSGGLSTRLYGIGNSQARCDNGTWNYTNPRCANDGYSYPVNMVLCSVSHKPIMKCNSDERWTFCNDNGWCGGSLEKCEEGDGDGEGEEVPADPCLEDPYNCN